MAGVHVAWPEHGAGAGASILSDGSRTSGILVEMQEWLTFLAAESALFGSKLGVSQDVMADLLRTSCEPKLSEADITSLLDTWTPKALDGAGKMRFFPRDSSTGTSPIRTDAQGHRARTPGTRDSEKRARPQEHSSPACPRHAGTPPDASPYKLNIPRTPDEKRALANSTNLAPRASQTHKLPPHANIAPLSQFLPAQSQGAPRGVPPIAARSPPAVRTDVPSPTSSSRLPSSDTQLAQALQFSFPSYAKDWGGLAFGGAHARAVGGAQSGLEGLWRLSLRVDDVRGLGVFEWLPLCVGMCVVTFEWGEEQATPMVEIPAQARPEQQLERGTEDSDSLPPNGGGRHGGAQTAMPGGGGGTDGGDSEPNVLSFNIDEALHEGIALRIQYGSDEAAPCVARLRVPITEIIVKGTHARWFTLNNVMSTPLQPQAPGVTCSVHVTVQVLPFSLDDAAGAPKMPRYTPTPEATAAAQNVARPWDTKATAVRAGGFVPRPFSKEASAWGFPGAAVGGTASFLSSKPALMDIFSPFPTTSTGAATPGAIERLLPTPSKAEVGSSGPSQSGPSAAGGDPFPARDRFSVPSNAPPIEEQPKAPLRQGGSAGAGVALVAHDAATRSDGAAPGAASLLGIGPGTGGGGAPQEGTAVEGSAVGGSRKSGAEDSTDFTTLARNLKASVGGGGGGVASYEVLLATIFDLCEELNLARKVLQAEGREGEALMLGHVHRLDDQLRQAWVREKAMLEGALPAERVFASHPAGKVMQDLHCTLGHDMAAALAAALHATRQTKRADTADSASNRRTEHADQAHSDATRRTMRADSADSASNRRAEHADQAHADAGRDESGASGHHNQPNRDIPADHGGSSGGDTGREDERRGAAHKIGDTGRKEGDTGRRGVDTGRASSTRGSRSGTQAASSAKGSGVPLSALLRPGMEHTLQAHRHPALAPAPKLPPVPPQIDIRVDVVACRNLSVPASMGGGSVPPGDVSWVCSVIVGRKKHSTGVVRGAAPRFDKSLMFQLPADADRSVISVTLFCRAEEGRDTAVGAAMIPVGLVRESPNMVTEGWYPLTKPGGAPTPRLASPPPGAPLSAAPCIRVLAKILPSAH